MTKCNGSGGGKRTRYGLLDKENEDLEQNKKNEEIYRKFVELLTSPVVVKYFMEKLFEQKETLSNEKVDNAVEYDF